MHTLIQDIRFGLRTLAKNPGFTAVAILTLALGIGVNTALFSVVNGVLLNPLPYPQADRLVMLHESKVNFPNGSISYPNFRDWQKDNEAFSSMAIFRGQSFTLTGMGAAEQLRGRLITSDFFRILGVKPVLGRTFEPGEDEIGRAPIVIISEGFWKRKFGGAPDVLGKVLTLDGRDNVVVGVIPADFDLLLQTSNLREVYVPIGQWTNPLLTNRSAGLGFHGIARLKPGVSLARARDDMDRVTRNLTVAYPDKNKGIGASVYPLRQSIMGSIAAVSARFARGGRLRASDRVCECW